MMRQKASNIGPGLATGSYWFPIISKIAKDVWVKVLYLARVPAYRISRKPCKFGRNLQATQVDTAKALQDPSQPNYRISVQATS